jgi:uncharacterized protein YbjT (DUF2867 family)
MILVTTAGKVGSQSARLLATSGHPVRVIVRDPDAHTDLVESGVELFTADLDQADTVAAAMVGVGSVVLVTPAVPLQEINVIDAARTAGVGHMTKITSDAAPDSPISRRRDHHRIEAALAASGLPRTLLRSNAYMQNLLVLAPEIVATGTFSSSTGNGRVGMVDARDVAAVAAVIAAAPESHVGETYRLSGPASLSYDDVASELTRILHRTIRHIRISTAEQEAAMVQLGLPETVAHANALALELFAQGDSEWITNDVPRIIGRPATGFAEFATDHLARFRGDTA